MQIAQKLLGSICRLCVSGAESRSCGGLGKYMGDSEFIPEDFDFFGARPRCRKQCQNGDQRHCLLANPSR